MGTKKSEIQKAIDGIEADIVAIHEKAEREISVLEAAVSRLRQQQQAKAARRPRNVAGNEAQPT